MFDRSAFIYDAIYSFKNYARESSLVDELIRKHSPSVGRSLLDVACGTGEHLRYLRERYEVEGLDLDDAMLDVARRKHPDVRFHHADMADFELGRRYDAVICLFSAVGYLRTVPRLRQAVATMARHLAPGGVLMVEPWLTPQVFKPGRLDGAFVDNPDLKVARFSVNDVRDGLSVMDFHYLVTTLEQSLSFTERHELGLFTHEEYLGAFQACGLEPIHDPEGLTGRGIYLGVSPSH